jgi:hypothetical protein
MHPSDAINLDTCSPSMQLDEFVLDLGTMLSLGGTYHKDGHWNLMHETIVSETCWHAHMPINALPDLEILVNKT